MPWTPLPRLAFAVCTYPFVPSAPTDLPLQIGDELYIIEQGGADGGWFRGYLVAPPSLLAGLTSARGQSLEKRVFTGVFPRVCVEIREYLGDATGVTTLEQPGGTSDPAPEDEHGPDTQHTAPESANSGGAKEPQVVAGNERPEHEAGQRQEGQESVPKDGAAAAGLARARLQAQGLDTPIDAPTDGSKTPAAKPPAPVPMLKIGDESALAKEEPLVDEIASCLREWHSTKLHELLLNRQYATVERFSQHVTRLDYARRQLLHKILTDHELEEIREQAIWDLVSGNKLLDGEVMVRSAAQKGRLLTCDDSAVEVSKLQCIMSLSDTRPAQPHYTQSLYHAFVALKTISHDSDRPTQVLLSVYRKNKDRDPELLSESYSADFYNEKRGATVEFDKVRRTLFSDLSMADSSDPINEASKQFLVVKVLTSEAPAKGGESHSVPSSREGHVNGNNAQQTHGGMSWRAASLRGGRQSIMLGRRFGRDADAGSKTSRHETPPSHHSSTSEARPTSASTVDTANAKPVKRFTQIGVMDITDHVRNMRDKEISITLRGPNVPSDAENGDEDTRAVFAYVVQNKGTALTSNVSPGTISLHMKVFKHPDSATLIQQTPTLLQNINVTRRIGFADAPNTPRSDIYFTLHLPSVPASSSLSHPRQGSVPLSSAIGNSNLANLQLTLEVRKASGERISNCIFPTSNSSGHSAWRTIAVRRGEGWDQTIKLIIPPTDVPGCHLVMSLAEANEFPFALSWMPLWNYGAFARDGDHFLTLYKYDEETSQMVSGKGAYLNLPWDFKMQDESVTGNKTYLRISTYLCSTAYSQDPTLLGLLLWKERRYPEIFKLLQKFPFVPEIEIVKLLKSVFNALFGIIVEFAGNEEIEDAAFYALVLVLSIVPDRRFNLQPLVAQYTENEFDFPFAFPCLQRSFKRLLEEPTNPESSRRLRATIKVGMHLFKFLVRARRQQVRKEIGIGIQSHRPALAKDLEGLFVTAQQLMQNDNPILVGTKTLLVQNFHYWLPELVMVAEAQEVLKVAAGFIDACSHTKGLLVLHKLILIRHICELDLFSNAEDRERWQSQVAAWLEPHWGNLSESTPQLRDQIRLCCSVVSALFTRHGLVDPMWVQKLIESYLVLQKLRKTTSGGSFSLLFPSSYPFPTKSTGVTDHFDEALIEVSALLSDLTSLPASAYRNRSHQSFTQLFHSMLHVCQSVLSFDAFPSSWLSVHIYCHKTTLNTLQSMFEILSGRFIPSPEEATEFDDELWKAYLTTLLKLVSSDALALETFPEQKRRAVWKIGGDVRELGAELLENSWEALGWEVSTDERERFGSERMGGYQVPFVPGLVGAMLELCLSVHEGLRGVAVSILSSMITGEWTLNGSLAAIETEMIDRLDELYKTKPITDGMLQKLFIDELRIRFSQSGPCKDAPLRGAASQLLDAISELLDLLIAVYMPEATGDDAFQILDTLRLLDYLKDMEKNDIYIGYVHKLAQIQTSANNRTEAALALKLHADLYEWDSITRLPTSVDPPFPAQSAFERKEQLYFQMIGDFEEANDWNSALSTYEELAQQYQYNTYDYGKLARTQRAMATIFEKIGRGDHKPLRYFRVLFRGLGFPQNVRDKQFIFEGSSSDRIASFTDRMQQQYPSAQVVSGAPLDELEGQYLSIYPVSAQRDYTHPVNRRIKALPHVKEYVSLHGPKRFGNTTRRQGGGGRVQDQLQDKILYETTEAFPTILRRSEIVKTETVPMTAVQIGLERTTRKTHELQSLVTAAQAGGDSAIAALTENLVSLVKEGSEGCVAAYWELLPDEASYGEATTNEGENRPDEYTEALRNALVDHVLAIRRALEVYGRAAQKATRAEFSADLESSFAPVVAYCTTTLGLVPPSEVDNTISMMPTESATLKPSIVDTSTPAPPAIPRKPLASVLPKRVSARLSGPRLTIERPNSKTIRPSPLATQTEAEDIDSHAAEPRTEPRIAAQLLARPRAALAHLTLARKPSLSMRGSGPPSAATPSFGNSHKDSPISPITPDGTPSLSSRLIGPGSPSAQAMQGLQSRMGSMTKRLSSLNVGGRGLGKRAADKEAVRSPEPVLEA